MTCLTAFWKRFLISYEVCQFEMILKSRLVLFFIENINKKDTRFSCFVKEMRKRFLTFRMIGTLGKGNAPMS